MTVDYPVTDSRILRNAEVIKKIQDQLKIHESKMEIIIMYEFAAFIVNNAKNEEVTVTIPARQIHLYCEFVFIINVSDYKSLDDIILFFSTNSGPELTIDSSFPYYFIPYYYKYCHQYPGRYCDIAFALKFLNQHTDGPVTGGQFYYEYHSDSKKKDLNLIHLVYKDSDNYTIYDSIFQDPSTGFLLIDEETDDFLSFLSNLFTCSFPKKKNYEKIKND